MLASTFRRTLNICTHSVRAYTSPTVGITAGKSRALQWTVASVLCAGVASRYYMTKESASAEQKSTPEPAFDPNNFKPFKIGEITPHTHNTKRFRINLEDPNQQTGIPVASCILLRSPEDPLGKPSITPYTPITLSNEKGHFDLLIKIYPEGKMSQYLDKAKPGDLVFVKGPIAKIPIRPNMKKHIFMLAGGSGITPMYQVLQQIFNNPEDKTKVTLLYSNSTQKDILLKKEFDDLAKKFPKRFEVKYILSKESQKSPSIDKIGRIDLPYLKSRLPAPNNDILVMVCGPLGFYDTVSGRKAKDFTQGEISGALKELGFASEQVFKF